MFKKIPLVTSIAMRILHQTHKWKLADIVRKYRHFAKRSVIRHAKKAIPEKAGQECVDRRQLNKGRPRKLGEHDKRKLIRSIPKLRKEIGYDFTAGQAQQENDFQHVSKRTVRRQLNREGYKRGACRKKGILTEKDRKSRTKFARKYTQELADTFWTERLSFYLDGVGFCHKTNPMSDAQRCKTAYGYKKKGESLKLTTKGKKEGVNGKMAHFFVAIDYNKGIVLCEQFLGSCNGESYSTFVKQHFPAAFKKSANPEGMLFLQDGDPTQNSKKAKDAYEEIGCYMFSIPARSPDLNPIENLFNNLRVKLRNDAQTFRIAHETYEEFCDRVKRTLIEYPIDIVDRTIESMPKRVQLILKSKGCRTKY